MRLTRVAAKRLVALVSLGAKAPSSSASDATGRSAGSPRRRRYASTSFSLQEQEKEKDAKGWVVSIVNCQLSIERRE